MLERDNRDAAQAERLVRWCQADEFWQGNIHSMPTFRRQYDKLRLKAKRTRESVKPYQDDGFGHDTRTGLSRAEWDERFG